MTLVGPSVSAQSGDGASSGPSPDLDAETETAGFSRASKGVEYAGANGASSVHLWLRTQFRYSEPFQSDPRTPSDFVSPPGGDLELNRARLKTKGTIGTPKVGFYFEQELAGDPRLLDLRLDLTLREHLRFRGDGRMWLGRYQWNFAGEPLQFSQSDFEFSAMPAGTLAFAAASFEGPYTRYSSDGGGQLDGYAAGTGERYAVRQWLQEFAWQYAGWSIQQEYHVKRIEDRIGGHTARLTGYYAQAGKAWPLTLGEWTRPVEVALRLAQVDQNTAVSGDTQRETMARAAAISS